MRVLDALLDALFPPRCAACRDLLPGREAPSPRLAVCGACEATLDRVLECCPTCGVESALEQPCEHCRAAPPPFDSVASAFRYGAAIATILHHYKYEDHPELAASLGACIAQLPLPAVDLVAPVPLHAARRRARTYDQALYLAQTVARELALPCRPDLLRRERATERQVGRSRGDRALNVDGAFRAQADVAGQRVLLIDDVVTTGATAAECARVLKLAGAREVHVASVARAT